MKSQFEEFLEICKTQSFIVSDFSNSNNHHSFCLTENKKCYAWGNNYDGQLGINESLPYLKKFPNLLILPNNEIIKFITCGDNHSFCLTENKKCYAWGNNYDGQLGLDDIKYFIILLHFLVYLIILLRI